MTGIQDNNSPSRPSGRRQTDRIVGASPATRQAVEQASSAARSESPVVIAGPSGSGRGHLGRAIHTWSQRSNGPLAVFSAVGTPEDHHQRELFGAAEGGEPLLDGGHAGALERAAAGTLLVRDVDALSASARDALAAAIASGSFSRVGETEERPLKARVIATSSTGTGLGSLEVHTVKVECLSDRSEDVLPLAAHFLAECAADAGTEAVGFTADARRWLVEEAWSGNVRELAQRVRQAVQLAGSGSISAEALMLSADGDEVPSFKEAKRAFETRYVEGLLRRCNGNISRAARLAKKDRKDFYDVIRRTGVDPGQFRP